MSIGFGIVGCGMIVSFYVRVIVDLCGVMLIGC